MNKSAPDLPKRLSLKIAQEALDIAKALDEKAHNQSRKGFTETRYQLCGHCGNHLSDFTAMPQEMRVCSMCSQVVCRQCICSVSQTAPHNALKDPFCTACFIFDQVTKQKNGDRHIKNPVWIQYNPRCAICSSTEQASMCYARSCTTSLIGSLCHEHTKHCEKCGMPFCHMHVMLHACDANKPKIRP